MTVVRMILACDESGAKGYADRDEAFQGEVGVFAGILVPEEASSEILPAFQLLVPKYTPASGKLHIADLTDDKKEGLRGEVYDIISKSGLPCFWYAIHVAGMHRQFKEFEKIQEEARFLSAGTNPRVKTGSPRSHPSSMHVALFDGLFAHLIAYLEERNISDVGIEIRSDRIDQPILEEFEKESFRLLSYGAKPDVSHSTGYDTVTKQVVHGKIVIEAHIPPELGINVMVKSLTFNPVTEGDGLVLAADVLANSLQHLFKSRSENELYTQLNRPIAVSKHPLFKNLDAFQNWGGKDLIGDCLFHHPKDPDIITSQ